MEDIEQKLNYYKDLFIQIEASLKQNPEKEEFIKLKTELLEIIQSTEELLKLKKKPLEETILNSTIKSTNILKSNTKIDKKKIFTQKIEKKEELQQQTQVLEEQKQEEEEEEGIYKKKKEMKEVIIPKSLKILPTDSEEVRQQKRRKIRAIKSQFRKKKMEEDRNNQKNAWKEFKEKTSKKPKIGFLSSIHRESIFKSPDTVFGKVGVIGSGKEPTPTPSIAPFVMKSKRISIPKDFMK